jgi:hypothetical protein
LNANPNLQPQNTGYLCEAIKNNSTIAFSYSCKKTILSFCIVLSCFFTGGTIQKILLKQSMKGGDKLENRAISQRNWISFDMQYSNGSNTLL